MNIYLEAIIYNRLNSKGQVIKSIRNIYTNSDCISFDHFENYVKSITTNCQNNLKINVIFRNYPEVLAKLYHYNLFTLLYDLLRNRLTCTECHVLYDPSRCTNNNDFLSCLRYGMTYDKFINNKRSYVVYECDCNNKRLKRYYGAGGFDFDDYHMYSIRIENSDFNKGIKLYKIGTEIKFIYYQNQVLNGIIIWNQGSGKPADISRTYDVAIFENGHWEYNDELQIHHDDIIEVIGYNLDKAKSIVFSNLSDFEFFKNKYIENDI